MRLRGIPGSANQAQAAHASRARAKREVAPRLPPVKIDKAAAESWEAEGGQLPEPGRKAP